jgi:hypothetical protein
LFPDPSLLLWERTGAEVDFPSSLFTKEIDQTLNEGISSIKIVGYTFPGNEAAFFVNLLIPIFS